MTLLHRKLAYAAVWVLGVATAGIALNVTSASGWMVVIALAVVPALVMLQLWNAPAKSMSESIREALR